DRAIVFEDDCLPATSFFEFSTELLERYKDEPRVMTISGCRMIEDCQNAKLENSYLFSRYPFIWGWATWRRAWKLYDPGMTSWDIKNSRFELEQFLGTRKAAEYWSFILDKNKKNNENWDYIWVHSCWKNSGLSIH